MSRLTIILALMLLAIACQDKNKQASRKPVAEIGNAVLYYDELDHIIQKGVSKADSAALVQNYVNRWAKRTLLLQRAEENLSADMKEEIAEQLEESRINLVIYQYQRQMMLEKMDTTLTEAELENYYVQNEKSFTLNSNIVRAVFIQLPVETPDLNNIRTLARSNSQADMQQLERICYQFAEKFDDFNEEWVLMDRLSVELPYEIENEDNFLKRTTFYETSDSTSVYMISFRDYRLRSTLAPFEFVRDDIKRIIINSRRFEFIQSLENAIYNEALKNKSFKIY
ncbi:MAG TPA: hypothetical protein PL123_05695 [Bacteroidales bacterium]|nr:hypothetical protein [Bacteroidales bacterium]